MLGPETNEVQKQRVNAVRNTWGGQIYQKERVFYVQWFGAEPILTGDAASQLLQVPSAHNATFVSRILWAYDTLVKRFDPDWIGTFFCLFVLIVYFFF